ncbi:sensor histidine kinase [Bailinhaonella thermotolerans]|uniref:Two-component sensor histidine kinase n=1 Tax=Bailinhaonella thermotolerans TaxID=1070861 RepID=A0A3A4ARP0_9ACTN|nr:histidine kinase [Bailinhaonella thermotolerans]RJL32518.1 two-component sensor histidine kinase [Bailinhaonella thermotolerans]
MRERAEETDIAPRTARAVTIAVLAALCAVYALAALPEAGPVALVAGVFAAQLVYVLPRLSRLRGPALLAVQAALGYALVLGTGASVSVLGFTAGSLLLTGAWPLAAPVLVSAAALQALRTHDALLTLDVTITAILGTLVVYGLTRLTERVDDVHATRMALAVAAVTEERLRIAAELNDRVGRSLDAVHRELAPAREGAGASRTGEEPDPGRTAEVVREALAGVRAAAADYRSLSLAPDAATARALLAAAGIEAEVRIGHDEPLGAAGGLLALVLRDAVGAIVSAGGARHCLIETSERAGLVRLRVVSDGVRAAGDGAAGLDDLPGRLARVGGEFRAGLRPDGRFEVEAAVPARPAPPEPDRDSAYALSLGLLAAVVAGFSAKGLIFTPVPLLPLAAVCLLAVGALQMAQARGRHRGALAVQAALTYLPLPALGAAWVSAPSFLAGSLLLALPAVLSWPLVAAAMAGTGALSVAYGLPPDVVANRTLSTLVTGLVIYGLVRLAQLVRELRAARDRLARAAVVQERLRTARDLHDLLGHSLAAILLKCELARRLAGRDPARARAELAEVAEMAERARADMRSVYGDQRAMTLAGEAESVRSVLAAAGCRAEITLAHGPLPERAETVLATVLREAVTNILRHSSATRCAVTTASGAGRVVLTVENDGVRAPAAPPGSGLGNLTTRLAALDGRLETRVAAGVFHLTAAVPVPVTESAVPAAS